MAKFSKDDWVEITSTPDLKWAKWSQNRDFYENFCGKIGKVAFVDDDPERPGHLMYKICVEFDDEFNDGFMIHPNGTYYAWFSDNHLLRSSEYDSKRKKELLKAGAELQKWEDFKKKSVNDALRSIFGPEPKQQKQEIDQWEEKTPVQFNFDFYEERE